MQLHKLSSLYKHLLICLTLILSLLFVYNQRDGWKDSQAPGDEMSYVEMAHRFWHFNVHQSITWSPANVMLMSPFIGLLGHETGFKVWRFILFSTISIATYLTIFLIFNSSWYGFILALYSQLFWVPYASPTLQSLIWLLYLVCLSLLTYKTRFLGIVFGLLLNGIYISGVVNTTLAAFVLLTLIFFHKHIFKKTIIIQSIVGLLIFVLLLVYQKFDITKYGAQSAQRGRAGLHHQMSLFIFETGRSKRYLDPNEKVPETYHGHLKAIEKYYLDKFGFSEGDLNNESVDPSTPQFLLDWPWLYKKDPALMTEYAERVLLTFNQSLSSVFQIIFPFGEYNCNDTSYKRGVYSLYLIILLSLPNLIKSFRKNSEFKWPSKLHWLFLTSTLAFFVPLLLVMPLFIYFAPLYPFYIVTIASTSSALVFVLQKIILKFKNK
ncbi:MAG: hypothetical protein U0T83_04140 [Bacteriovoracaceae bacterium]